MINLNLSYYHTFTENDGHNKKICYFTETTLEKYVKSLPGDYDSYWIQRDIVENVYLNKLITSIISHNYMPSIILTGQLSEEDHNNNKITLQSYKILDGLQRTYRMKLILDAINQIEKSQNQIEESHSKFNDDIKNKITKLGVEIQANNYKEYTLEKK